MTRRDYSLLARAMEFVKPAKGASKESHKQWVVDVRAICDVLSMNNPRFDRQRFYAACGMEGGE